MSPGVKHEMPLDMIQRRPAFALELLALALGIDPAGCGDVRIETVNLSAMVTERTADSVTSISVPRGAKRLFVIVEVQNEYVEEKWWRWCAYVGTLMDRHKSPVILVIVCPDAAVAAKYDHGFHPDYSCLMLRPVVIGPDRLPRMVERDDVLASPEMATLAAVAHPDLDDAIAVSDTLLTLGEERGWLYYSYLVASLPEAIRADLEAYVSVTYQPLENDLTRSWEARGEARGQARGEARGEARGQIRSLLDVLRARGIPLDDEHQATVLDCTDTELLGSWIQRAVTAQTLNEIFTD